MSEYFEQFPSIINVLVVYDADNAAASQLAEKFVSGRPKFDLVVVIGPFTSNNDSSKSVDQSCAEGDMASTLAQLENITCRVVYLSADSDPPDAMAGQLNLTPNSVNIYARHLVLRENLFVTGFTETNSDLKTSNLPDDPDRSAESDDELDGVEINSSTSAVTIIQEIIDGSIKQGTDSQSGNNKASGIFVLNYKYIHTLNNVLFHMTDVLVSSGLVNLIIPHVTDEALRLPTKLGNLSLILVKSLRNGGNYTTISMEKVTVDGSSTWKLLEMKNDVI